MKIFAFLLKYRYTSTNFSPMIIRILTILLSIILSTGLVYGSNVDDFNLRDSADIWSTNADNRTLSEFTDNFDIGGFFFVPSWVTWKDGILEAFTIVAFNIKNIVILLAALFLVIAIIKLLFSPNDEESVKKWRSNIIWVTVGVFIMQMTFSIWKALLLDWTWQNIDSRFGWAIWLKILLPIVWILQLLASFGFLLMVIYAFYLIVWGAWDEEKVKKGKKTIIYGLIGFFLMRMPEPIIRAIYGTPKCEDDALITIWWCEIANNDISWAVWIIGKIILYANWFLMLVCVILIIYAGWLVLISGWDEEKLKKAKSTILYVIIGFIVLIGSNTIFKFFILQG